jgi:hypothetical protein
MIALVAMMSQKRTYPK